MAAEWSQAEAAKIYNGEIQRKYILCVEGSVSLGDDGNYCVIAGRTAIDILKESATGAKAIIVWGSCATSGCVQAASLILPTQFLLVKLLHDKPIINVPRLSTNW